MIYHLQGFILISTNDIGENKDENILPLQLAQIIQKIQDNLTLVLSSINLSVSKAKDKN